MSTNKKESPKLRLRALRIIDTYTRAFTPPPPSPPNKSFFFVLCCVVSIVRYSLKLKNPRKATCSDSISQKFIKFASNVIDSPFLTL